VRDWGIGTPDFEELERRVAQRDRAAFSTLHRAYEDVIQTFLIAKTHDPRRARTLTAKVFDLAWKRIDRYPWRDFSFQVWLMRIARDEVSDGGPEAPATEA
jgi:DNA-directed RNA polymerase specialized sigma24 family protein